MQHFLVTLTDVDQCDQIGRFWKVVGIKFAYKSSPIRTVTFGLFCNRSIDVKQLLLLFGQLKVQFGVLFLPTFGHSRGPYKF